MKFRVSINPLVHTFSMEDTDVINSISKERLLGLIQAKGMYSQSCFAEQVGYQMNNLQFLVETKRNCFDIIEKLIPYKEYLTDKQIVCIEKIRDSSYFHLTKIYENSPVAQIYYNSEQFKNELSKELYDIICCIYCQPIYILNKKRSRRMTTFCFVFIFPGYSSTAKSAESRISPAFLPIIAVKVPGSTSHS